MCLESKPVSIVALWFQHQFLLKSLPWLSFRVWLRSPSQINLLPQAAFCLVFTTATEGRLEYPPLFFLIVTLFTYGFCQTCYITVPYLFCQGVCFTALLITLAAQPWWICSPLSVWPIIVASHYLSTPACMLLNFSGSSQEVYPRPFAGWDGVCAFCDGFFYSLLFTEVTREENYTKHQVPYLRLCPTSPGSPSCTLRGHLSCLHSASSLGPVFKRHASPPHWISMSYSTREQLVFRSSVPRQQAPRDIKRIFQKTLGRLCNHSQRARISHLLAFPSIKSATL